jgi:hypothetical protein
MCGYPISHALDLLQSLPTLCTGQEMKSQVPSMISTICEKGEQEQGMNGSMTGKKQSPDCIREHTMQASQ